MAINRAGVMAAPNRCELTLRVVSATCPERFPNKQELIFVVLAAEPIKGPDFATQRVGQSVNGFTFDTSVTLTDGVLVNAEAEYLGGAHQGYFQLYKLKVTEP